ncbi:MAG: hypothetical protein OHK0024_01350 [Thalassobaculales bacterium]
MPGRLAALARHLDRVNHAIGRAAAWAALAMVLLQFAVVLLRYVFGIGHVGLSEGVMWLNAVLFLLGGGYTLARDAHVRVDIWYRPAGPAAKAAVDLAGVMLFLLPLCLLTLWSGWPFFAQSVAVLEGSKETSGLPGVFLLKGLILVWALLLAIQAVAIAASCLGRLGRAR